MNKITLSGYMGAGKSAIGQLLAKKCSIKHFDLDELIEEREQKSISNIFKDEGEVYFRKIESKILNEYLSKDSSMVLSLGGGTPCYANNHQLLHKKDVISVFLKTSVDVLIERLRPEKHNRPLIAHLPDNELKEYINKHLFDRNYYYLQSKFIVSTDNKSEEDIAEEILKLLDQTT